jgi:nitroreductase
VNYLDILNARFACKKFDNTKQISDKDKKIILEAARLSPSSFGLEPWQFVVISDGSLREKLKPACWGQNQITDASFIVVTLSRMAHNFRPNSEFVLNRIARKNFPEEMQQAYLDRVQGYLSIEDTTEWAKRQCYIALTNMLNAAQSLAISSCPMEGYEEENVTAILRDNTNLDLSTFELSGVIAAFGYSSMEQPEKLRAPVSEVVIEI